MIEEVPIPGIAIRDGLKSVTELGVPVRRQPLPGKAPLGVLTVLPASTSGIRLSTLSILIFSRRTRFALSFAEGIC